MHKLTTVLLLMLVPVYGMCQNTVTGKVVDELGLPIYLASVAIHQTDEVVFTDYEGNFKLVSDKHFHWKIHISSAGYKPETYFVLDGGNTESLVLEYDEEMRKLLNSTSEPSNEGYGYLMKNRFYPQP